MSRKLYQEIRHHPIDLGPVRKIAEAEGYVMIRRPGCMPTCMMAKRWQQWKPYDAAKDPNA